MKKFIALFAIAVAPALFAQEKAAVNKVSDAQKIEASKVEKKADANVSTAKTRQNTATAAKGTSVKAAARTTAESEKMNAVREEKAK
ncbi:hypothetical protein [Moheibacter lacus]|uniref:Uncharacterized protein n=1 Tax=Moheibacter lacus TaxID=2745851 RepID=A0A838ZLF2_9FLAO|nr:hypothetical protein [Moheibacter lacus]MBA5628356.1 hypothetical protein [Moheibacter lacus]